MSQFDTVKLAANYLSSGPIGTTYEFWVLSRPVTCREAILSVFFNDAILSEVYCPCNGKYLTKFSTRRRVIKRAFDGKPVARDVRVDLSRPDIKGLDGAVWLRWFFKDSRPEQAPLMADIFIDQAGVFRYHQTESTSGKTFLAFTWQIPHNTPNSGIMWNVRNNKEFVPLTQHLHHDVGTVFQLWRG